LFHGRLGLQTGLLVIGTRGLTQSERRRTDVRHEAVRVHPATWRRGGLSPARGARVAARARCIIACTRRERTGSTGSRRCVSARIRGAPALLCHDQESAIGILRCALREAARVRCIGRWHRSVGGQGEGYAGGWRGRPSSGGLGTDQRDSLNIRKASCALRARRRQDGPRVAPISECGQRRGRLGWNPTLRPFSLSMTTKTIDIRQLLLQAGGHSRLAIASGGHEALALLACEKFSLVLLDMMMPDLNGDEVLKIIKGNPDTRDVSVVVLSADTDTERIPQCIEIGADDYLPKPFNPTSARQDLVRAAQALATIDGKRTS
jgi:CheY-like chemotaxis protein